MSGTFRALVVEDDPDISDLVEMSLQADGLDVVTARSGAQALEQARSVQPDLITLDLTLPDMDGVEICRELREFTDAYIIMITGRTDEIDRLQGLQVGADDYLAKPFSPAELRARAGVLLRRPRQSELPSRPDVQVGRLVVSPDGGDATVGEQGLGLAPAEVEVLAVLAAEPGRAWRRDELTREVWKGESIESDFLVDVHVANIRRKLRAAGESHRWIATVAGTAYRLDPDDGPRATSAIDRATTSAT